jgi:cytochrome c oxidase subunit I+III
MLGMIAVLFTVFGALAFSYFYLRLYSDQWPQGGLDPPELTGPFVTFGLLAAGGIAQIFSAWGRHRGHRRLMGLGMASAAILGLGFASVELANLVATPFSPTANAYGSIFFTINGFSLLIVLIGVALQTGVLVRLYRLGEPLNRPRLTLWLQNTQMFWFFAVAIGSAGLIITYLVPYVL